MESSSSSSREEAVRKKVDAEQKIREKDYGGARKLALEAQDLCPELDGLYKMLETLEVLISGEVKVQGEVDWYRVLRVEPFDDETDVAREYFTLSGTLSPSRNKTPGADDALRLISDAWDVLSDPAKRTAYDLKTWVAQLKIDREQKAAAEMAKKDAAEGKEKEEISIENDASESSSSSREEAVRKKVDAEQKIREKDYGGARKLALDADDLCPELDGLNTMLETLEVLISGEVKVKGEVDWYRVLRVEPFDDKTDVKKAYSWLALKLSPSHNKTPGADDAFRLISDAWDVLSDAAKKSAYDRRTWMAQLKIDREQKAAAEMAKKDEAEGKEKEEISIENDPSELKLSSGSKDVDKAKKPPGSTSAAAEKAKQDEAKGKEKEKDPSELKGNRLSKDVDKAKKPLDRTKGKRGMSSSNSVHRPSKRRVIDDLAAAVIVMADSLKSYMQSSKIDVNGIYAEVNSIPALDRKDRLRALNWLVDNENKFLMLQKLSLEEKKDFLLMCLP